MLPIIAYLDLETTGGTPLRDRITEIALVRVEQGKEVARWQTLVNPETPIPYFIQNLTGITDDDVCDAPAFSEVAGQLKEYLDGAVMVAHNARFDHGFLKSEYRRFGYTLRQRVMCTVKLSRKLYPDHKRHGLDAIMKRHNLTTTSRHRAMGDVDLMMGFIASAQKDLGLDVVEKAAMALSKQPSLPAWIDQQVLDGIPDTSGVYLFYGENDLPLYIGKSIHLRERVMSHFSGDHGSSKEMRMTQEMKRIDFIETAGELGALLLESRLVKKLQPIYNRQLRRKSQLYSWCLADEAHTVPQLSMVNHSDIACSNLANIFGTFRSKAQANKVLSDLADKHSLCLKVVGLEKTKGKCFAAQLHKCKGVCEGKEKEVIHRLRLEQALVSMKLKSWPYKGYIAIKEYSESTDQTDIHIFNHWCHITTVNNEVEFYEAVQVQQSISFDYDSYKLILKAILKPKSSHEIIEYTHSDG